MDVYTNSTLFSDASSVNCINEEWDWRMLFGGAMIGVIVGSLFTTGIFVLFIIKDAPAEYEVECRKLEKKITNVTERKSNSLSKKQGNTSIYDEKIDLAAVDRQSQEQQQQGNHKNSQNDLQSFTMSDLYEEKEEETTQNESTKEEKNSSSQRKGMFFFRGSQRLKLNSTKSNNKNRRERDIESSLTPGYRDESTLGEFVVDVGTIDGEESIYSFSNMLTFFQSTQKGVNDLESKTEFRSSATNPVTSQTTNMPFEDESYQYPQQESNTEIPQMS